MGQEQGIIHLVAVDNYALVFLTMARPGRLFFCTFSTCCDQVRCKYGDSYVDTSLNIEGKFISF